MFGFVTKHYFVFLLFIKKLLEREWLKLNLLQRSKALYFRLVHNDRLSSLFCYIIPFACLGGYLLELILNGSIGSVNGYYLIHYLYTYDHGFVARGLVGEVISWFFDVVTDDLTYKVVVLFSFLLMLSAVLCIGKALTKVKNNPKLFLVVVLLSVSIFITSQIVPVIF